MRPLTDSTACSTSSLADAFGIAAPRKERREAGGAPHESGQGDFQRTATKTFGTTCEALSRGSVYRSRLATSSPKLRTLLSAKGPLLS